MRLSQLHDRINAVDLGRAGLSMKHVLRESAEILNTVVLMLLSFNMMPCKQNLKAL